MSAAHEFDEISIHSLREAPRLKWALAESGLGACVAEMDFGTAPEVATALIDAVAADRLGYLAPALEADLQVACASWQQSRYGWAVHPDDVRVLPDVIRALHVAITRFSRPGSPVIVPVPAYMPFLTIPSLLGRRVIQVPLAKADSRYIYDLSALEQAFLNGGNLLILCNPHNPVGCVLKHAELRAVCEIVTRHGGRVFADEIHAPIVYPGHHHVPYASTSPVAASHSITATSASKAWNLAGLKCAQVVLSNDPDRERWQGLGRLDTDAASTLGVVASTAAYSHGESWLDSTLTYLDVNRFYLKDLLDHELPEVGYVPPEGTFLAWLDFRKLAAGSGLAVQTVAERAQVTVVDGADCGSAGNGYLRLNFATARRILEKIVNNLAQSARMVM